MQKHGKSARGTPKIIGDREHFQHKNASGHRSLLSEDRVQDVSEAVASEDELLFKHRGEVVHELV